MRRRFNSSERVALYLAADGRCSSCGDELTDGWHADHIHPHSRGGATDVINGQALCPTCNVSKGDKTIMTPQLSTWQEEAVRRFRSGDGDFLTVACPAAGKTRFALAAARHQIDDRGTEKIIVIVPNSHLRRQWAASAAQFGIHLDSGFENKSGGAARDYHGVVVTYAAVDSSPHVYRRMSAGKSLVIFDEVHHAGDQAAWGDSVRFAFENAGRRLLLSGTPKRSDGTEIPFVTYDENGAFVEDYLYDYGAALEDYRVDEQGNRWPVVRPVDFNVLDGRTRWITATEAEVSINLKDTDDDTMANALRSALEPSGDWMVSALTQANMELNAKRAVMPDAGGLVVAGNQLHARRYAAALKTITGEEPTVAVSDEPEASRRIEQFNTGESRWIVAVAMVSEGVDIPRLGVCVYATSVRTELFFRQVVGRVIRSRGAGDIDRATMFIPGVEPLVRYASEVEQITRQALDAKDAREVAEREVDPFADRQEPVILGGEEAHLSSIISRGEGFTHEEVEQAKAWIASNGFPENTPPTVMAKFVRSLGVPSAPAVVKAVPEAPLVEQKKQARNDLTKLVGKVAHHVYGSHRASRDVRYDLRTRGYDSIDHCTLEQIKEQHMILVECLQENRRVA